MVVFFDLLECNSRQNGSSPISARRFCTTDKAAIFSATNNTRFPWNSELAIILVMVTFVPVFAESEGFFQKLMGGSSKVLLYTVIGGLVGDGFSLLKGKGRQK